LREEVDDLLASAPRGKGSVADLATLEEDAGLGGDHLAEAERALAAGDYLEARAKAGVAIESLNKIKNEVQAAARSATAAGSS
jgi:hypothetical protein